LQGVAYVPRGSVAAGETIVVQGGSNTTIACAGCHGARWTGAEAPPLAGRPPTYIVRQLWAFKTGTRHGNSAAPMQLVTARMTTKDMLEIAAFMASRPSE